MKMFYLYITICILASTFSCSKEISIAGEYEAKPKTLSDRIFLRKMNSEGRIIGSRLSLAADSTFIYITCGNEMSGRWTKKQDSILLFVATNNPRVDNPRTKEPAIVPKDLIIFKTRNRQLYHVWEAADSSRFVELLTKSD